MSEKMPSALPEVTKKPSPEEIAALKAFISQKDEVFRTETALLHPQKADGKKGDLYALAALFNNPQRSSQEYTDKPTNSLNVKDGFIDANGVLSNIKGKDTINSIMNTPGIPKTLTLQVPGTISEGRGVKKDVPHEIQWNEKQQSYLYVSGSAAGLRPFIKDGMILGISKIDNANTASATQTEGGKKVNTTVTEGQDTSTLLDEKKLKIAETKNEKFMTEQPGIKDLIFEYLPKIMKSNEKMSFKQASLLIAQFQADNKLVPIDGYISSDKSPTAQLLLDKCAEAKIAYMWTHEQRGGNNYLPNGVKFVAPIDESGKQHLTKKLKEGQNIDDAIHDVNSQCASLITFMNSGISGNAWTMPDNIINEGGEEIVNTLRNADWSSITEITTAEEIQRKIQEQVRRNPIDPKKIKVGDVITMMHPKSTFQLRAFAEGSKTDTKVVSTHVGQVTESGGILYVTHNIHGTVYSEPLSAILAGNGTAGDIATGVFRLNTGNDIISSWNRKVAKVTTKLGKEWGKIKEDTDNMFN